jgi:hypothetical protein
MRVKLFAPGRLSILSPEVGAPPARTLDFHLTPFSPMKSAELYSGALLRRCAIARLRKFGESFRHSSHWSYEERPAGDKITQSRCDSVGGPRRTRSATTSAVPKNRHLARGGTGDVSQDASGSNRRGRALVGSVTLSGGGSTTFAYAAARPCRGGSSSGRTRSRRSRRAGAPLTRCFTECSDEETDCPSDGDQGVKVKKAER